MKKFRFQLIIFEIFLWGILWASPLGNFIYINKSQAQIQNVSRTIPTNSCDQDISSVIPFNSQNPFGRIDHNRFDFNSSEKEKKETQSGSYLPYRAPQLRLTYYFIANSYTTGNQSLKAPGFIQLQI